MDILTIELASSSALPSIEPVKIIHLWYGPEIKNTEIDLLPNSQNGFAVLGHFGQTERAEKKKSKLPYATFKGSFFNVFMGQKFYFIFLNIVAFALKSCMK